MWDIHEKIDALGDEINSTENSLLVLQKAFDSLLETHQHDRNHSELLKLSDDIHKCQDTLRDLKDERDALIDLLFDEP